MSSGLGNKPRRSSGSTVDSDSMTPKGLQVLVLLDEAKYQGNLDASAKANIQDAELAKLNPSQFDVYPPPDT
ncbi:hypothetical protein FRC04_003394 [Tulasnella sp. 424]|nr:hypothetical protein FRC04_003394 [Tulasnella sp. 424]